MIFIKYFRALWKESISAPNTQIPPIATIYAKNHDDQLRGHTRPDFSGLRIQPSHKKYLYYVRPSSAFLAARASLPPSSFLPRFSSWATSIHVFALLHDHQWTEFKNGSTARMMRRAKTRGGKERREETDEDERGAKADDVVKTIWRGFRLPEDLRFKVEHLSEDTVQTQYSRPWISMNSRHDTIVLPEDPGERSRAVYRGRPIIQVTFTRARQITKRRNAGT